MADIVLACSDSTDEEWKKTVGYWERKEAYLETLEATDDERAVLVSIADKVHNARAIVTDLQQQGLTMFKKFKGTAGEILTYYVECLRIAETKNVPPALLGPGTPRSPRSTGTSWAAGHDVPGGRSQGRRAPGRGGSRPRWRPREAPRSPEWTAMLAAAIDLERADGG